MKDLVLFPGTVDVDADAEVKAEIVRLWDLGLTTAEISSRTGVKTRRIQSWAEAGKLVLSPRGRGVGSKAQRRPPSPSEIRARCAEVQRTWSEFDRQSRLAGSGRILSPTALLHASAPPSKIQVEGGINLLPQ